MSTSHRFHHRPPRPLFLWPAALLLAVSVLLAASPSRAAPPVDALSFTAALDEQQRANAMLGAATGPIEFPDVKAIMAEVLPPRQERPPAAELIALVQEGKRSGSIGGRSYHSSDPIHWLLHADDPDDADLFRPLLDSEHELLRGAACLYLGRIGDQKSYEAIVRLTQDSRPHVRRMAVEALGMLGRPEAVPHLVALFDDHSRDVRGKLPAALGGIPGPEATLALTTLYRRSVEQDQSLMQSYVLRIIKERGDPAAVPDLIEALNDGREGYAAYSLVSAIQALTGHVIKGDSQNEEGRRKMARQWAEWWSQHGDELEPPSNAAQAVPPQDDFLTLTLESTDYSPTNNKWSAMVSTRGRPPVAMLVIPVADEGIDGHLHYVLYQDGREVARGDLDDPEMHFNRYNSIPFGSLSSMVGGQSERRSFTLPVPPGEYELALEGRFLCTELTYFDQHQNGWGNGPLETKARTITLASNRVPITVKPRTRLTKASLDSLARLLMDPDAEKQEMPLTYKMVNGATKEEGGNKDVRGPERSLDSHRFPNGVLLFRLSHHSGVLSTTAYQADCGGNDVKIHRTHG